MLKDKVVELIDEIAAKRVAHFEKERKIYPRDHFIASDIVACDRYMVFSVLNWQDRTPIPAEILPRLAEGNKHEKSIISELLQLGYEIIENQLPIEIKDRQGNLICRGKIDGKIKIDNKNTVPFEIKTISPHIFNSIKSIEDFSRKEYLKKYIKQIMLYLYGNNAEYGIFILDNLLGQWKILPVELNYEECEKILQQLERCYGLVTKNIIPEPIPYDENLCSSCPFASICLNDIKNAAKVDFTDDEDLKTMLSRWAELRQAAKEFDTIDEAIKLKIKNVNKGEIFVGDDYRISIKEVKRKSYEIPDDIKQQYAIETTAKSIKIIPLKQEK